MPLRIEKDPEPENRPRCRGEVYSAYSGRIGVGAVMEILEHRLVDRTWTERRLYWAWGLSVSYAPYAPAGIPQHGQTATLEEAIAQLTSAWDQWVEHLDLTKAGLT